ncbi:hypothetical protein CAPTEDRAFT_205920 [Capitella teleta]|uniref:Uncharacterized protein n=1 Tax=Capitella teleta TaxID=283909 RepID=R7U7M6_CAPTE|nr:hypothetical protein CAPTEDRAFT_205920 [Capitella teleta]|eukprot:ELU02370.1 hypothetical protein CAPTEDRAFT_205920 [Capitella teleta]
MGDNVVFDPLLTYVASARNTSSVANLKAVILSKFIIEQIKTARVSLWDAADSSVLGEMRERRDGVTRTAKEAVAEDIIEAFLKLESNEREMPIIAVRAEDLHIVPRIQPEEVDVISLADRMGAVEDALVSIKDMMSRTSSGFSRVTPTQETRASPSQGPPRGSTRPDERKDPLSRLAPRSSRSGSRNQTSIGGAAETAKVDKPTMAEVLGEDTGEPFQEVFSRKKKPVKRGQQGSPTVSKNMRGGTDTFYVQLTNVHNSVEIIDIKNYT